MLAVAPTVASRHKSLSSSKSFYARHLAAALALPETKSWKAHYKIEMLLLDG